MSLSIDTSRLVDSPVIMQTAPVSIPFADDAEPSCFSPVTSFFSNIGDVTPWKIVEYFNTCVDHWREALMIFGTVGAVAAAVATLFVGISIWWAVAFLALAGIMGFAAYQMGDILTSRELKGTVKELSGEVGSLKIVRADLETVRDGLETVRDDLRGEVSSLTTKVEMLDSIRADLQATTVRYQNENTAHAELNQNHKAQITELDMRLRAMKNTLEMAESGIKQSLDGHSQANAHSDRNNTQMSSVLVDVSAQLTLSRAALEQTDKVASQGLTQQQAAYAEFLRNVTQSDIERVRLHEANTKERQEHAAQMEQNRADLAARRAELVTMTAMLEKVKADMMETMATAAKASQQQQELLAATLKHQNSLSQSQTTLQSQLTRDAQTIARAAAAFIPSSDPSGFSRSGSSDSGTKGLSPLTGV